MTAPEREALVKELRGESARIAEYAAPNGWAGRAAPLLNKAADMIEAIFAPAVTVTEGWHEGAPPKPYSGEWFIAETSFGDRVVLKELPEEFSYDFKTADETYIKRDKITRWMQFPDSDFVQAASPRKSERDAVMQSAFDILEAAPELNMSNYDHDQVGALNKAMIEAFLLLKPIFSTTPQTGSQE